MTFDEAASMLNRIKDLVLSTQIKGIRIDSFFIGPTDWNLMTDYLNKQIQDGPGAAIEAFAGRSFSLYGVHKDSSGSIPGQELILLDGWETMKSN